MPGGRLAADLPARAGRSWIALAWRAMLALVALLVVASARAEAVDPKPYFANPEFREVRISPSGKYLAALAPSAGGRIGLAVMSLDKREPKMIAVVDGYDIGRFSWVNDERLVYSVFDAQSGLGEQNGGGLFAVDREGQNTRMLEPTAKMQADAGAMVGRGMQVLRTLRDGSDDILVLTNDIDTKHPDVFRVNAATGRKTLESLGKPGDAISWIPDANGRLRGVVTDENTLVTRSWWKPPGSDKWTLIGTFGLRDSRIVPVAFDGDGSMIVASNVGRDTFALYRFDAATNAVGEELAAYPRADFEDGLVYDYAKKKIVGMRYDAERAGAVWFDDDWARVQAAVDKALPDTANQLARGDASHFLVTSFSDRDPGRWYLLDTASGKLELLGEARKAIDPAKMPARKAVRYPARDGLEIPGFLTLPRGRAAHGLPLIVLVHGGPNVRGTHWAWNPEAAYLAALGYAVLEPDYRGSMGWGTRLFQAGWKQWGRSMQDDLNDGMDWLAQQGTIDPKRACIMGASYGGYAVMEGLARDPLRWRCGINYVGVTDISLMFSVTWSDFAGSDYLKYAFKELVGDPDKDAAMLKAVSPLEHAANIKAPVLMAYGGSDRRVPIIHGERMRDAIEKNGTPLEWVVYQDEAHGFLLEKNRYDFYSRVAAFLGKYLPANP
ncbi:MAG: prolyl oligopeptidase family serine peptidase [Casimicrobiaceae bacterium]